MANADGFFTHPLRGAAGGRQVGDIIAQTAGFDHFGGGQQDAAGCLWRLLIKHNHALVAAAFLSSAI